MNKEGSLKPVQGKEEKQNKTLKTWICKELWLVHSSLPLKHSMSQCDERQSQGSKLKVYQ